VLSLPRFHEQYEIHLVDRFDGMARTLAGCHYLALYGHISEHPCCLDLTRMRGSNRILPVLSSPWLRRLQIRQSNCLGSRDKHVSLFFLCNFGIFLVLRLVNLPCKEAYNIQDFEVMTGVPFKL